MYYIYRMNQNRYGPQSGYIVKSYGSVNVYDDIRDKWITLQTHQIGDLKFSAHELDHHGWLICDGRSLSRTDYAELYEVVGISFGANDSSTFKIPDMRGRVAGGIGDGPATTNRPLGTAVGEEEHTLTVDEMPTHNHTGTTDSSGAHTHGSNAVGETLGLISANGLNTAIDVDSSLVEPNLYSSPVALTIDSAGAHTHNFTSGSTGGGLPHNNMQPTLFIGNMFIYAPSINSVF